MDKLTRERRSANMAQIRSKDTKPELTVRRLSHSMGYRHRLHRKDLPGKPDLVYPGRKAVVFVHGCFWHQHPDPNCREAVPPKSRLEYWGPKLARNVERDAMAQKQLTEACWKVLVIWECEIKDEAALAKRLFDFLGPPGVQT